MAKRNCKRVSLIIILVITISMVLTGCIPTPTNYQTKPDFDITQRVTLSFLEYYSRGEIEKALEHVADDIELSTDSGDLKGKEVVAELIRSNYEKDNMIEVLETNKIENSKIRLIIANKIPLFQLAGVDMIKTREDFEVQDGKIVRWEIQHLKESVEMIEKVAAGTIGVETEVQNAKIVVTKIRERTPAKLSNIEVGDIVLSIDGVKLEDMKYGEQEIPFRLIGEVGSRVEMEISRGSETHVVKLRRVNINNL